jgi:hypothetical protein
VSNRKTLQRQKKKLSMKYESAPTRISLKKNKNPNMHLYGLDLEVSYAHFTKDPSKLGKYVENNRQSHILGKKKVKYTRQTRCRTKQPREGARAFPSVTLGPFFLFLFFSIFIV